MFFQKLIVLIFAWNYHVFPELYYTYFCILFTYFHLKDYVYIIGEFL